MRKLIASSLLALSLTACQTTSSNPPASLTVNAVVGVLPAQVQQAAVQACGYLPTAQTVAQLVAAFGGPNLPGVVTDVANEICAAVTKKSFVPGRRLAVHGVPIRGRFVK
jgi:hypothetical protein